MHEGLANILDDLQALTKGKDLSAIKKLIKRFDDAVAAGDRTAARAISKEALTLEKKYIPLIPHNQAIAQQLKCENMIMSVGFQ